MGACCCAKPSRATVDKRARMAGTRGIPLPILRRNHRNLERMIGSSWSAARRPVDVHSAHGIARAVDGVHPEIIRRSGGGAEPDQKPSKRSGSPVLGQSPRLDQPSPCSATHRGTSRRRCTAMPIPVRNRCQCPTPEMGVAGATGPNTAAGIERIRQAVACAATYSRLPFCRATPTMRNSRSPVPSLTNECASLRCTGTASPALMGAVSSLTWAEP